ncbi:MAG: septum formation initiator family protein [Proteobacteria bacterium]|nr:septum formation initiator family protein [Pseudomonadota bacterium]
MLRLSLAGLLAVALGYAPLPFAASVGVGQVLQQRRELRAIVEGNVELAGENRRLLREIEQLRRDPRAIERAARDDLGLVGTTDLVLELE